MTERTAIKVANAPCSWGVLEFDLDGTHAPYSRVLDEMAQAGYTGTELGDWGFMPTDPSKLEAELRQRDLSMLAAFVPVDLSNQAAHQAGLETALKTARLLRSVSESPFIVMADDNASNPTRTKNAGRIQPKHGLTDEQWQTFAQGLEMIARTVLDDCGVKTVFHHHCAGYVETAQEVERLLSMTNPLLVGLCFDTGHYAFGGGDPVEGFKKHRERIWHVHFKDCDQSVAEAAQDEEWDYFQSVNNGIFCELGKGRVRFPDLVAELQAHNYSGWVVVEQDILPGMGSPLESAVRNREYLAQLGL